MSFDTCIYLNDLGKETLGHIFTNAVIPVKWIFAETATLEDKKGKREIYRIDINYLSDDQFEKCIDFIMLKNEGRGLGNVRRHIVEEEVRSRGFIPIQGKYVSFVGTKRVEIFL